MSFGFAAYMTKGSHDFWSFLLLQGKKANGETARLVLILNLKRLVDEVEMIETREDKCLWQVILKW